MCAVSLSLVLTLSWCLFSRACSLLSHPFNLAKQPLQEHYSTLSIHFCNTGQIRLTCHAVSRVLSLSPRAKCRLLCTIPLAPCNMPSLVLTCPISCSISRGAYSRAQRRHNDDNSMTQLDTTTTTQRQQHNDNDDTMTMTQ